MCNPLILGATGVVLEFPSRDYQKGYDFSLKQQFYASTLQSRYKYISPSNPPYFLPSHFLLPQIRLQLTKPGTWIPLLWGVACGAAASGNYHAVISTIKLYNIKCQCRVF
jgi:hypothetical protein